MPARTKEPKERQDRGHREPWLQVLRAVASHVKHRETFTAPKKYFRRALEPNPLTQHAKLIMAREKKNRVYLRDAHHAVPHLRPRVPER